ncbi:MAG: flagellar hook-basal body complex protein [Alphaproteobacteria bacterium]|nr:flagellar hook-basal body complex protein [Alphaproteobacteria bacterium]
MTCKRAGSGDGLRAGSRGTGGNFFGTIARAVDFGVVGVVGVFCTTTGLAGGVSGAFGFGSTAVAPGTGAPGAGGDCVIVPAPVIVSAPDFGTGCVEAGAGAVSLGVDFFTVGGSAAGFSARVLSGADGFAVSPEVTIPDDATSISINAEGEVYGYFADNNEGQLLGQFSVAGFSNAKGLEALGGNLFQETEASGPAIVTTPGLDGMGTLRQGYLEDSSVDVVHEMTELIEAQRGYELNAKVISAVDQMMSATVQVR